MQSPEITSSAIRSIDGERPDSPLGLSTSDSLAGENTSAKSYDLMPSCTLEVPLALPSLQIVEVFRKSASKNSFGTSAEAPNMIKVTYKRGISFCALVRCCSAANLPSTSAQLHIGINEASCSRQVSVKGLSGDPFPISSLIQDFSSAISKLKNELPVCNDEGSSPSSEITSYYEFCKILSAENYSLGKNLAEFFESFDSNTQVGAVKGKIEETVKILFSDYNFGRKAAENVMVFCRPAVEKFVFNKVGTLIVQQYKDRYEEIDQLFRDLRDSLESENLHEALGLEFDIEFPQSVEQINRLPNFISPNEKLNCLKGVLADVRSSVLEYDIPKGMEPYVIAFVLLRSTLECPMAEVMFLKDWHGIEETSIGVISNSINLLVTLH